MIILTKNQFDEILNSVKKGINEFEISLDLGRTISNVKIKDNKLFFKDEALLDIEQIKSQRIDDHTCYSIDDLKIAKVQTFSNETNSFYKLVPTSTIPTLQISGIFMHRHLAMDPMFDTILKIKEISPIKGDVLDTCCGLGYTAIFAAQKAQSVITCEKDPNVLEICKFNPFSEELFWNKKIKIFEDSILDKINSFENAQFDRIIHDPPSIKIADELYTISFYRELYRVLKPKGLIYHYTGLPESKSHNRNLIEEVAKKFKEVGFIKVKERERSLGVAASK